MSVVLSLQREGEERSDAKGVRLSNDITEYRFYVPGCCYVTHFLIHLICCAFKSVTIVLYQECSLAHNLGNEYFRESIQKPYLRQLIKQLNDRFEDKSLMSDFDPANIPLASLHSEEADDIDDLNLYGMIS